MSKIFEAIRRASGEISEPWPEVLKEGPDEPPATSADGYRGVVEAVIGGPRFEPATPQLSERPDARPAISVRTLPIRLAKSAPLLPFDNTHRVAAEQYRIIRTKLLQHPKQPRMVLISSAASGDGKSVTAVNLAGALALIETRTLLIDTDIRRPTIHTQLGLPASPGLTDILRGTATLEQALIQVEQLSNLYVITVGELHENSTELLDSPGWRTLCDRLRVLFGYVVADSPPVASVADYDLLQSICDGVIAVVRPDHSERQMCLNALRSIPREKLIGVIVNGLRKSYLTQKALYKPYYFASYCYENNRRDKRIRD